VLAVYSIHDSGEFFPGLPQHATRKAIEHTSIRD
jgi:hypothetical protein